MLACAVLEVLAWGAGCARAASEFGSFGSGAGQLYEPNGIAVEQASGDVYVVDTNNRRVAKFTQDGAFLLAWGWGVADGRTPALQTCVSKCYPGLSGRGAGQFGFAEGVAVDNDPTSASYGDVYVVDLGQFRVEKFNPVGEFLLMFGGGVNETAHDRGEAANEDICPVHPGDRCGAGVEGSAAGQFDFVAEDSFIAVGSTGTVYVADRNRVQEFSSAGVLESQIKFTPPEASGPEAGGIGALAVDGAGDLYVVRNGVSSVTEYGPSGEPLRTFDDKGEPEIASGPTPSIALDAAGDLFIDDFAGERHSVLEYGLPGRAPVRFDVGGEDGLHGIAVDKRSGSLYVLSTSGNTRPPVAHVRVVGLPRVARSGGVGGVVAEGGGVSDLFEYGVPASIFG